jgi:hypothetical protein
VNDSPVSSPNQTFSPRLHRKVASSQSLLGSSPAPVPDNFSHKLKDREPDNETKMRKILKALLKVLLACYSLSLSLSRVCVCVSVL